MYYACHLVHIATLHLIILMFYAYKTFFGIKFRGKKVLKMERYVLNYKWKKALQQSYFWGSKIIFSKGRGKMPLKYTKNHWTGSPLSVECKIIKKKKKWVLIRANQLNARHRSFVDTPHPFLVTYCQWQFHIAGRSLAETRHRWVGIAECQTRHPERTTANTT